MVIRINIFIRGLIICATIFLFSGNTYSLDEETGKKLHEKSCVSCHGDEVYKRESRRIKSYKQLETQVRRCNVPAKANFDNDQITAVTDYINSHYYKYDPLK